MSKSALASSVNRIAQHVRIIYNERGLETIFWDGHYDLNSIARTNKGAWNIKLHGWSFKKAADAQKTLDAIVNEQPDWPVIDVNNKPSAPMVGMEFSRIPLKNGFEACLVPATFPPCSSIECTPRTFVITDNMNRARLMIDRAEVIKKMVDSMVNQGAVCNDALNNKWCFSSNHKLQVEVTGWTVKITCDMSDPLHYLIAPEQKHRWVGEYPNGTRIEIPWEGEIHITRKHWPSLKAKLQSIGLEWEGDNPEAELTAPASFDVNQVAGWDRPAPNGYLLHAYQKNGAQFCASRGMRALIGDEMGIGKTVQAIAAAEAISAPRVLVVCPANARYVWDREILGWGGRGAIQHITNQLDKLDTDARWHIITYDLLAARTETWRLNDESEKKAFVDSFPDLTNKIDRGLKNEYPFKISLDKPLSAVPNFARPERIKAWKKIMQRLNGELLEQILSAGPMLVILDEAHRVKNRDAKRSKAIQRIAANKPQLLMLTGTPLRNNEHEAAALLGLLDEKTAYLLSNKYTIDDVKDYLNHFMIRRTKKEVLPELPEKTRQRIDISNLSPEHIEDYRVALKSARDIYNQAIEEGASEARARQRMQGSIEHARTALGISKVCGGDVLDIVLDVVENKSCCVVFCAHQQASDDLKKQLETNKLRVAIIDGRTPQNVRGELVKDFQEGRLDVLIGGINAAGEAITLTRADTVVFVELDWVPAAMMQAEDRIHRVGQKSNCQIIQLIARLPVGLDNLDEMMIDTLGSKLDRIGAVLSEDSSNIISGSMQSEVYRRLLACAPSFPITTNSHDVTEEQKTIATSNNIQELTQTEDKISPPANKRSRGRPKVYIDKAPANATERSKQSIKALASAGGKRIMLRLSPDAYEALKFIMELAGATKETGAINQAIIDRKNDLQLACAKNK